MGRRHGSGRSAWSRLLVLHIMCGTHKLSGAIALLDALDETFLSNPLGVFRANIAEDRRSISYSYSGPGVIPSALASPFFFVIEARLSLMESARRTYEWSPYGHR